jgi:hypothetical protein
MVATMPRVRSTEEVAVFRADCPGSRALRAFDVAGMGVRVVERPRR